MRLTVILLVLASFGAAEVRFNRDIRPIMAQTCFRCHGPDKNARMAGMRLDLRDEALRPTASGAAPIVPGDSAKSAIIQRVFATNSRIMPPASIHKELTASQKEMLRQWVTEGAKYEGHWAYQPVERPGALSSIDGFVQSRLAAEHIAPSSEADRRTLIRRVTLDLTGLPPTPADVAAFIADHSPNAYEKVVGRLLASDAYAEQQTMHWLDAVRYADTCGFHGDNAFPAWPYRDYVLHAFRDNKPFDVFTREQLAGDLLPGADQEQRIASAYNRLNRTSAEGGLQPKEYLAKYAADRVRTTVAVWMGSTLGCAECHDHKFDPFTSRDFYSMKAFFADIKETGLVPDRGAQAWGSVLALPTPEQQTKRNALEAQLAKARARLSAAMEKLASERPTWEQALLAQYDSGKLVWHVQQPLSAISMNGASLRIYHDELLDFTLYDGSSLSNGREPANGLIVASGANPDNETYTVTFQPAAGTWTALGIEVVQDESLPGIRLARGSDRFVLTEVDAEAGGRRLQFSEGISNQRMVSAEYPPNAAFDGDPRTGWSVATYNETPKIFLSLRFAKPVTTEAGGTMTVRLHQDSEFRRATIGRFRLALSSGEYSWPTAEKGKEIPDAVLRALRTPEEKRTDGQKKAVAAHFQWATPAAAAERIALAKIGQELALLDRDVPRTVVTEAAEPVETRILPRGNWMDESGEIVEPAIPAFLGKLDTEGRRATRLDLANWLVSPENPLTARVFVNRLWRQFFGTGLSKTLDDLGSQGEWPSHPELLDWLASEFVTHGWDVKHIIRAIVTSQTYRQSSATRPELAERDPENRLLARQNRFRVDAEVVRDIALAASGLLVPKFGGPSAKPYQPDGYLATLNFPKREYSASHGEELYRRGIYTFWQRSFLHPSLLAFDAPTREECTFNRTSSNTPLQALVLLNDPIFVEAARLFAQNMMSQRQDPVGWAFERAVSRLPTADERRILEELRRSSLAQFERSPGDAEGLIRTGESPVPANLKPSELAAMTIVARAILNMHETITRN
jgi:hypothetical protein